MVIKCKEEHIKPTLPRSNLCLFIWNYLQQETTLLIAELDEELRKIEYLITVLLQLFSTAFKRNFFFLTPSNIFCSSTWSGQLQLSTPLLLIAFWY